MDPIHVVAGWMFQNPRRCSRADGRRVPITDYRRGARYKSEINRNHHDPAVPVLENIDRGYQTSFPEFVQEDFEPRQIPPLSCFWLIFLHRRHDT